MVKSELVAILNLKLPELQGKDVALAIDCIMGQMVDALAQGGRVEIRALAVLVYGIGHRDSQETLKRGNLLICQLKLPPTSSPARN